MDDSVLKFKPPLKNKTLTKSKDKRKLKLRVAFRTDPVKYLRQKVFQK